MKLGSDKFGNMLYWDLADTVNGHLLAVGATGHGKTYKICQMLKECSKEATIIVLDETNRFKKTLLETGFEKDDICEYFIYQQGLPVNVFKRQTLMIGEQTIPEANGDLAERVLESLKNVIGKAPRQRARVRNILNEVVSKKEEKATLSDMRKENIKYDDDVAWTLDDKFAILGNLKINEESIDWELIEQDGRIFLINLAGFKPMTIQFIVDVILQDVWYYAKKRQCAKKLILCLDELQNYQISKEHVICKFLAEGRKYGVNMWCATQIFKVNFPSNIKGLLMQAGVKLFFKSSDEEAERLSKLIDKKDDKFWEDAIKKLEQGQFVCMGDIHGEFHRINVPVIVSARIFDE